ncbi:AAA family ATPase [Streptomyces sp. NPDC001401]|uniref:AAA family ATPase n=1 Tax=Streptomyces sp. NPDC001401 TaxID=3364570 RepID=UPI00368481E0
MTSPSVRLKPLVSWPESVEDGRKYLVTVDVEFDTGSSPWPYDTEEYEIGCMLEGGSRLAVESVGDTTLVLHRFGGTYGPARFVTYAIGEAPEGPEGLETELQLTLITAGGVPFRSERLGVRVGGVGPPVPEIEVPLPREAVRGGGGESRQPTGTVMVMPGSGLLASVLRSRLVQVERRTYGVRTQVDIGELPGTSWRVALVASGWWSQPETREAVYRVSQDFQVPLVVSVVLGRGTKWQEYGGGVVVATEVLPRPRSRSVRPSERLVMAAREALGSSAYFEAVTADGENSDCLTAAYAVPAAEHFTVCAVGTALDRAVDAMVAVLRAVDPVADPLALPPDPDEFVGRDDELSRLLDLLDPAGALVGMPNASVLTGMPGVGKTALAVAAAHEAMRRGWFPGGVRYLSGGTGVQEVRNQIESWLRNRSGPALFVCDALDSWEWLTSVGDASLRTRLHVLATSRRRPEEFSRTKTVMLEPLSSEAAAAVVDPDGSHPTSAARLAELCGGVPLALRLARGFPRGLDNLLARAEGAGGIFDALDDLKQAYDAEYRSLPGEQAEALRWLALSPRGDLGREMAVRLLGNRVERLEPLVAAGLVTWNDSTRRWRLPTLVHAYVEHIVRGDEAAHAERVDAWRILGPFCTARTKAAVASLGLAVTEPGNESPELMELPQALEWLDGECENLIALVLEVPELGESPLVGDLALHLGVYLNWRRYCDACVECCNTALVQERSRHRQAQLWNLLGAAQHGAGRLVEAAEAHAKAAALFRALDNEWGIAKTDDALGLVRVGRGDWYAAQEAHRKAQKTLRRLGDHLGEAEAITNLGRLSLAIGANDGARAHLAQATSLYQPLSSQFGTAWALVNYAEALRRTGGAEEALTVAAQALSLFVSLADTDRQAWAQEVQAEAYEELRRFPEASNTWTVAAETYTRAGDAESAVRALGRAQRIRRDHAPDVCRLLVTVATAPFRSSSVRWALHVSRGSGWEPWGESGSAVKVSDLSAALHPSLDERLRTDDPDRLEFALPLGHFDLAPHRWPTGQDPDSPDLGTQVPLVLRDMARAGRPETVWLSRWRELREAPNLSVWHLPIAGASPSFPVPPDGIPFLCGPVSQGSGRDLMSRLLKDGHGAVLWTAGPHPKQCGPDCLRLRDEVQDFLSGLGPLAELPHELWQLRTLGRDRRLSLLYDDPESPLPAARRPST